jgi:hypothetical protein
MRSAQVPKPKVLPASQEDQKLSNRLKSQVMLHPVKSMLALLLLSLSFVASAQENQEDTDSKPDPESYCRNKWTADSLFYQKDYLHALPVLQKCVELRRTNQDDYYMLALCYSKLRDDSNAVINLKYAIDIGLYHWRPKAFEADSNLVPMQRSVYWKKISKSLRQLVEDKLTDSIGNRVVQAQLVQMRGMDQKFRVLERSPENQDNPKALGELIKMQDKLDSLNQVALRNMISLYGWPGYALVGREGDNIAWLILQHAGDNLNFLKYCLDHMQAAMEENDTNLNEGAALMDKVLVLSKKKQIYGTQFHQQTNVSGGIDLVFEPIEDEVNVDKRRHCLGLTSLDTYKDFVTREMKK